MSQLSSHEIPLHSVHTTNFPAILTELGISLVVSTYQAGKVVLLRADQGVINTHFRVFEKPMGIAADQTRMAIGTAYQVWELRNVPAVAAKLNPPGRHDACYLPRRSHITGDIDIHEMAYVGEELWCVNTRFSCLCTLDAAHSFVPRWRPPFITAYDLGDRCHLNGLGVRDNQPRYVTTLGTTDTPGGWRSNKASGGVLMDIQSNQILLQGLSMPHSPRWYGNQLWFLESGTGSLASVDPRSGTPVTVAQLPGFTRGLDFYGPLAFIGLSQVRETAVFSGIPITEQSRERNCGVWVVNIQTGETIAFLRFETAVQEIFAVTVLPNIRFPELIDWDEALLGSSYVLPDEALANYVPLQPQTLSQQELDPKSEENKLPVIESFSVIVPVYNVQKKGEAILQRTLKSIEASIDYWRTQDPEADRIQAEIVLVDDASTDDTWEVLHRMTQNNPLYQLVQHSENKGQGAARNTGVRSSQGKVLFFCDDDDCYLEFHIWLVLNTFRQPMPAGHSSLFQLPDRRPTVVKTGVRFQDALHPHWKQAIQYSIPTNLCVRREAHDFIQGFPEDPIFCKSVYGMEDYAYNHWLITFCSVVWEPQETVEHFRYPGNHFDRQLPKFQKAPGDYQEIVSEEQQQYLQEIELIVQARITALQQQVQILREVDRLLELGNAAYQQRNLPGAAQYYQQCLALKPDFLVARYNLGVVAVEQQRWDLAEVQLQQVIATDPNHVQAHNNLGILYQRQHQLSKAMEHYRQAIALQPHFPDAHMNLGMALLQQGDLPLGFTEFEWRWQTNQFTPFDCPHPQWEGQPLNNKTLLIYTEQGAGDAIQFIRYVPLVAERCDRIILVCMPELLPLFETVPGITQIRTPGEMALADFDTYIPLMSLPRILGTTLDTIPAPIPYLKVRPDRKLQLPGGIPNTLKVGIVWSGSPTHRDNPNRSCAIQEFLPVLQVPGVSFFSLQKGPSSSDRVLLPPTLPLWDVGSLLQDFADTAAAINQLDLVISVDTSVVHLAGALGKPVWTLLSYSPDWRWLLTRLDSPWYPTMRLFRQPKPGDWAGVFQQVKEALKHLV